MTEPSDHADRHACYVGSEHVGPDALCVDHLSFTYPDGTQALDDVCLHVTAGSTLAIIGPNGAGKSTLLKILLGLLNGWTGKVLVDGMSPARARKAGGVMAWVPQRSRVMWDFPATVEQVVAMGWMGPQGRRLRRNSKGHLREVMETLEIAHLADRSIGDCSGGQQQRAILARALAVRPKVLLLDEPTTGLDPTGLAAFSDLLAKVRDTFDVTLVVVSHDLRTVVGLTERIACLNRKLHFHDAPGQLTPELLGEVFRCDLTGLFPAREVAGMPGTGQGTGQ